MASAARLLRRAFGVLAGLVAAADLAVATAVDGNSLGLPPVAPSARTPMLAYGAVLVAVAVAAIVTSFRHEEAPAGAGDADPAPTDASTSAGKHARDERKVVHALRHVGWYVADDIVLNHVDVDHVAIGPAGVLAIQTQWTDRPDHRGKPAARARIAAHQLRSALAQRELDVEVVPAVLTFGPGLTREPGGVKVVDAVAVLNGYQADEWLAQLTSRTLLSDDVVDAVRTAVGDLREGHGILVPALPAAARTPELVH
jgi:hypothetical protein